MAATVLQLPVLEGVKVVHRPSDTLTPKFSEVGVGSITLKDVGGALDLGGATLGNLALQATKIFIGNASNVAAPVVLSGHATIDVNGVLTIANNAVDTPQIKNGAVVTGKLSGGLQTELSDHETRLVLTESEIAQLQLAVAALQANTPQIDIQTATGVTDYTVLGALTFDVSNAIFDIDVYVDGRLQTQDVTGASLQSYKKLSATAIRFTASVGASREIKIFKRGTSSGPAVNLSSPVNDLTAITVAPAPAVNGDKSLGTTVSAWKSVFIKDKVTSQIYELEIVSGVPLFTPV